LVQLGYPVKEATLSQLERIIKNTDGFDKFAKHIISLNDEIKKYSAIVALSNSKDYLKIKCDSQKPNDIEAFKDVVSNWSSKYKVALKQLEGKNSYYILGMK